MVFLSLTGQRVGISGNLRTMQLSELLSKGKLIGGKAPKPKDKD